MKTLFQIARENPVYYARTAHKANKSGRILAVDKNNALAMKKPDDLTGENLARIIRLKRNLLLQQSDWTQLNDVLLDEDKKRLWSAYRQSLRDLPEQTGFPHNVLFPEKP